MSGPADQIVQLYEDHANPRAALIFTSGTHFGEAIGSFESSPLYHASLDRADDRQLLADNGFDVVSHVAEDHECEGTTIWLAQLH